MEPFVSIQMQMLALSKACDVAKMPLIALDHNLCIKHVNLSAKKIFSWKKNKDILNYSLSHLLEVCHLPFLVDQLGNLVPDKPLEMNGYIIQWQQLKGVTNGEYGILLIG